MYKKNVLCLLVVLVLLTVTACQEAPVVPEEKPDWVDLTSIDAAVTEGNRQFAFDLLRLVHRDQEGASVVLSPLSVSTALTMTYNGARGQTREEMERGLRYSGLPGEAVNGTYTHLLPHLQWADPEVSLALSNSIWYREGEAISGEFLETTEAVFDAEVAAIDFSDPGAADTINGWIGEATEGKIEKMIAGPIGDQVVMYLINAVYFKGEWTDPFDPSQTYPADFYRADGSTVQVDMMRASANYAFAQEETFSAVRIPYGVGTMAMYAVLPAEGMDLDDLVGSLDESTYRTLRDAVQGRGSLDLHLPRFEIRYGTESIKPHLIEMEMELPFTEGADFSGIRDYLMISDVLHQAVIEVNEEGSEAAAATVVEMVESAAPGQLQQMVFDRPFLFMIIEEETDTLLFLGTYSG
jgi:serpin B